MRTSTVGSTSHLPLTIVGYFRILGNVRLRNPRKCPPQGVTDVLLRNAAFALQDVSWLSFQKKNALGHSTLGFGYPSVLRSVFSMSETSLLFFLWFGRNSSRSESILRGGNWDILEL